MRAFLKSSEGCFQLKAHTTTIGRHEGSDIVLQVGSRKPVVLRRMVVCMRGGGCTGVTRAKCRGYQLASAGMYSKEKGARQISNKT